MTVPFIHHWHQSNNTWWSIYKGSIKRDDNKWTNT